MKHLAAVVLLALGGKAIGILNNLIFRRKKRHRCH